MTDRHLFQISSSFKKVKQTYAVICMTSFTLRAF